MNGLEISLLVVIVLLVVAIIYAIRVTMDKKDSDKQSEWWAHEAHRQYDRQLRDFEKIWRLEQENKSLKKKLK